MQFIFMLLIPLLIIFIAPVLQIKLCRKRLKNNLAISILLITLYMMPFGVLLSFAATIVSLYGYSFTDVKCAIGAGTFIGLGTLISLTVIPFTGIYYGLKKRKIVIE